MYETGFGFVRRAFAFASLFVALAAISTGCCSNLVSVTSGSRLGADLSLADVGSVDTGTPPDVTRIVDQSRDRALTFACAAAVVGVLYALVSAYWAAGGTALLDTIGGSLEHTARARGLATTATLSIVAALKLFGAWLPIAVVANAQPSGRARRLAQIEAALLTVYGLVLTSVGLLVQAGVIHRGAHADQKALAWHAFFWDPWFLLWGLLIIAALRQRRTVPRTATSRAVGHDDGSER